MTADERDPIACPPPLVRDGCRCPPFVTRCAHFEGRVVWLMPAEAVLSYLAPLGVHPGKKCPRCKQLFRGVAPFLVASGRHEEPACLCASGLIVDWGKCRGRWPNGMGKAYPSDANATFTTESEALAAFGRDVAALLGREAAL